MQLEDKKIKVLARAFDLTEDKVRALLNGYMALSLHNMIDYKFDETMFGEMFLNTETRMLEITQNSEFLEKIFNGNVDMNTFKSFLQNSNNEI